MPSRRPAKRITDVHGVARITAGALCVLAVVISGCKRKHVEVESVPELGYPTCDGGAPSAAGTVIAQQRLRGQPDSMAEAAAVETTEIRRADCLVVLTLRQEWANGATDVEVVYDDALRPLRAWRRMTLPTSKRADGDADVRRYELRTPEVTITKRTSGGPLIHEILHGTRPTAVIGPGRGSLTPWIQRAKLGVGEKVRESVLDFREMLEVVKDVTLKREPDLFQESLGRTVRVYTIYGREAVFADEHDVVIGDLAGLRPSDSISTPAPPPLPTFGAPDPVHTP